VLQWHGARTLIALRIHKVSSAEATSHENVLNKVVIQPINKANGVDSSHPCVCTVMGKYFFFVGSDCD
jgi:hypothetical protein